jgi:hypothetical protein
MARDLAVSLAWLAALLVSRASGAPLVGGVERPYYGLQAPAASECSATGPRINCGEPYVQQHRLTASCTAARWRRFCAAAPSLRYLPCCVSATCVRARPAAPNKHLA